MRGPRPLPLRAFAWGAWALLAATACAPAPETPLDRRFADLRPGWVDPDRTAFAPPPRAFYSPYFWDAMDHAFFRGAAEVWTLERPRRAANVNALDEVSDSSWYTNRLSRFDVSPEALARGACPPGDPAPRPWRVVAGKPDGLNPGFTIEDAAGVRHLLKTDGRLQPERATGADVLGAILHHAAGYHVPCNRIVHFRRADLHVDPDARVRRTRGTDEPLTEDDVNDVLAAATQLPDGRLRASVSRFVEGEVIGPWRYWGTEPDDPNDVFDHRDRRELRALYVLSAWTDHVDARQENTLRTFLRADGEAAGHVRHWLIDFGDCFGLLSHIPGLSPRFGHSGYFDVEHVLVDFATLGLLDRPWNAAQPSEAGPVLGYYDAARFDADGWRGGYPNPAYEARQEGDAAWMARILARFEPAHLEAAVAEARFGPVASRVLLDVLSRRRAALLERYLARVSPLTDAAVREDGQAVCVEDRAVTGGIRAPGERRYGARLWRPSRPPEDLDPQASLSWPSAGRVCARLPPREGGVDPYAVLELFVTTPGRETPGPLEVHLALDGAPRVLGLARPEGR